jgi:hypothetical protein
VPLSELEACRRWPIDLLTWIDDRIAGLQATRR